VSFVHDDREFDDLVQIVAGERRLARGLVEKDYWVTHTLWALHAAGFEVWFKGGTSLSKGFGLIQRFSEDLDLKVESGTVSALSKVSNWKTRRSAPPRG
jgi:predicted nucleotidyltransferase component of viral defense system